MAADGLAIFFGHAQPEDTHNPFFDSERAQNEAVHHARFNKWIASYWAHGEVPGLKTRKAEVGLSHPQPTLDTMSPEDLAAFIYPQPGKFDGGSDTLTMILCGVHGVYAQLKDGAFYLDHDLEVGGGRYPRAERGWDDIEVRVAWCDHSIWQCAWASRTVAAELDEAVRTRKATRKISLARLRGKNHFVSTSSTYMLKAELT